RIDWLRSRLDDPLDAAPRGPHDDQRAVSSSAGLNAPLPGGGNVYASWAGAFKAPTLEQLYDRRPYVLDFDGPGPQPGVELHLSSNQLKPQRGWNAETGVRARALGPVWLDAAGYYGRSNDEIGYDLANFRFSNIDRSIHYGIESQLASAALRGITTQIAYT